MKREISGLKAGIENLKNAPTDIVGNEAKGISEKKREDLASKASSATTQEMTGRVRRESNLMFYRVPESQAAEVEERISADTEYAKDLCSYQLGHSVDVVACKIFRPRDGKISIRPILQLLVTV